MAALRIEPGTKEYDRTARYIELKEQMDALNKEFNGIKDEVKDFVRDAGEVIVGDKVLNIKVVTKNNCSWKGVAEEAIRRLPVKQQDAIAQLKDGKFTTQSEAVSVVIADYEGATGAEAAAEAFGSKK